MKKKFLIISLLVVLGLFLAGQFLPGEVLAQTGLPTGGGSTNVTGEPAGGSAIFTNPLKDGVDSLPGLLGLVLDIMVQIGTTIVIIAIIYAGFLYTTARGNERQITKAHTVIKGVLIGSAIILGAFVIAQVIKETAEDVIEGVMIEKTIV